MWAVDTDAISALPPTLRAEEPLNLPLVFLSLAARSRNGFSKDACRLPGRLQFATIEFLSGPTVFTRLRQRLSGLPPTWRRCARTAGSFVA